MRASEIRYAVTAICGAVGWSLILAALFAAPFVIAFVFLGMFR